ncbi:MAG: MBL fold metallo-hydrolase, partial [Neisseriaceae bacterium]
VWLGHASFLITLNNKNILLDPVFFNIPLFKRLAKIPFSINNYNSIDYILISHAHFDHLDKTTIKALSILNPQLKIYCGLGTSQLINNKWKLQNTVVEAGWYQQYPVENDSLEFYFMPALHWSKRTLYDRNKKLWGSFVIKGNSSNIYFMGDSGYSSHFKEIGNLFDDLDYVILGIGAYNPQNIMQTSHLNPEEAKQAYIDLGAKYLVPMHYGTYDLTDEPRFEPLSRIKKAFESEQDNLKIIKIGEMLKIMNC